MNNQKLKFIITSDEATAKKLLEAGFVQLEDGVNGCKKFLNKPPKHFSFSSIDKNKVLFTNIMSI